MSGPSEVDDLPQCLAVCQMVHGDVDVIEPDRGGHQRLDRKTSLTPQVGEHGDVTPGNGGTEVAADDGSTAGDQREGRYGRTGVRRWEPDGDGPSPRVSDLDGGLEGASVPGGLDDDVCSRSGRERVGGRVGLD